jgi:pyruvate,water dikinase
MGTPGTQTRAGRDPWRPIGDGRWVGTDISERFPLYTRANAGEVYPLVYRPLSFSIAQEAGERAMRRAILATGLIRPEELAGIPLSTGVVSGVFGGYAYLNLSITRRASARVPGGSATDAEAASLGATDAPPHVPLDDERSLRASLAGLRYVWKLTGQNQISELDRDEQEIEDYLASLPDPSTATDLELLRSTTDEFIDRFSRWFETHLVVSSGASALLSLLSQMMESAHDDPTIATRLMSGIGDVDSAVPSRALWALGRSVRASPELTRLFDGGVAGLGSRMHAAIEPDAASARPVAAFLDDFATFTTAFGSRGPNEWDTAFDTWETDPELALALIDRLRHTDPSHAPDAQHDRLAAEREELEVEVMRNLRWPIRRLAARVLRSARFHVRSRERAKTTIVRAIHGARLRGQELDRRLVSRSGGQRGDMWFLLEEELEDYIADPVAYLPMIAERRELHDRLSERIPPFYVDGEMPALETWELRSAPIEQLGVGDSIAGLSGCVGVARGRARVVTDPGDPRGLEPGDVLVAPHTDPSWTPLFVSAEAVVVDVGAAMSHAVIVSRELGIPCAISVVDATRRIPDGALVEVDGGLGTVTMIEQP